MSTAAQQLAERYDRDARAYRDQWAPVLCGITEGFVRSLSGPPVGLVLDVGTGVGSMLPCLRTVFPGTYVVGIDRSPGMLALAPEFPRAVMDATRLGVRDGCADLVLLAFMLFHLDSPLVALREARRALREGGRVATVTWETEMQSRAGEVWAQLLDSHAAPDPLAPSAFVDSPSKMESLLIEAGFSGVRSWAEDVAATFDLDSLLLLKTTVGSSKRRLDGLSTEERTVCLADARARLATLTAEDFVARGRVVFSVGTR